LDEHWEGALLTKERQTMATGAVALVFWLAGLAIIGVQIWGYLQTAAWQPFSIVDAGRLFTGKPWFSQPEQWLGLYRILDSSFAGARRARVSHHCQRRMKKPATVRQRA
jgi:hypothetical protein